MVRRKTLICIALLASVGCERTTASTGAQTRPTPPPAVEHHVNPSARSVNTTYACADGQRSIAIAYDDRTRGTVVSLQRNGEQASPQVLREVNAILSQQLSHVSAASPQCGSAADSLFVSGMRGRQHATILLFWSPNSARLVQVVE